MLTELFEGHLRPKGVPTLPVLRCEDMRGRRPEAWAYERVGPVVVRIDALETILSSMTDPRLLARAMSHLELDAATGAWLLRHLRPRTRRSA